jgi:hypothetical protein
LPALWILEIIQYSDCVHFSITVDLSDWLQLNLPRIPIALNLDGAACLPDEHLVEFALNAVHACGYIVKVTFHRPQNLCIVFI